MSIARAVGRNTLASLVARSASLLVWFALTPTLLARLGTERFGFWSLLLAFGGSVATIDLGLGVALSRFVAESEGRGERDQARRMIVRAVALQMAIALACALIGALLRRPLLDLLHVPALWRPEAERALLVALFGFALGVPANLFAASMQGLQRMEVFAAVTVPLAVGLAIALSAAVRVTEPLVSILACQVAYNILSAVTLGLALHRLLLRRRPEAAAGAAASPGEATDLRRLVGYGVWVQVNSGLAFLQANVDKFMIATFVALSPVAAYELGGRITGAALLAPSLMLSALLPAVAHRTAADGAQLKLEFYRRASYPYFIAVGLVVAALIGLAHPLLEAWLGSVQAEQVFMVRGLALAIGLSAATGIASTMVRAGDRLDLETQYALVAVVLHVVLSSIGIRLLGWPGVIYGLIASSLLGLLFFLFRVEAWLGGTPLAEAWSAARAPLLASVVGAALAAWVPAEWVRGAPGRVHGMLALLAGGVSLAVGFGLVLVLLSPRRWRELFWPLAAAGRPR